MKTILSIILISASFFVMGQNKISTDQLIPIAKLELFGKSLSDDVIVIGLSENTHGDGDLFLIKTEIIKYLHKEKGFNAVLMESDFLAVGKIIDSLNTSKNLQQLAEMSIQNTWAQSEQYLSLLEYLKKTAEEGDTLYFEGFDPQFTGKSSFEIHSHFSEKFLNYLTSYDFEQLQSSLKEIKDNRSRDSLDLRKKLEVLKEIEQKTNPFLDDFEKLWLSNISNSIRRLLIRSLAPPVSSETITEIFTHREYLKAGTIRDSLMAENILHYLSKYGKVIIWAANNHLLFKSIPGSPVKNPMGSILKYRLGNGYQTFLPTYYQGAWAYPSQSPSGEYSAALEGTLTKAIFDAAKCASCLFFTDKIQDKVFIRKKSWTITHPIIANDYFTGLIYLENVEGSRYADEH